MLKREVEVAKYHLRAGDHGRALLALKKKQYQEHVLLQTDNQLLTLEQLVRATPVQQAIHICLSNVFGSHSAGKSSTLS